jgi:hypothetical protein
MKKILVSLFALASLNVAFGQKTVVVLEPVVSGDKVTAMQKEIVRSALEESITGIEGFAGVINADVDQLLGEESGSITDSQRKAVGKLADAELICITQITAEDGDFLVKSSLVEVDGGRTVRTVSELMKTSPKTELQDGGKRLAKKLIGADKGENGKTNPPVATNIVTPDVIQMVYVDGAQGVSGFSIGKYEVTQAQWDAVMDDNPSEFKGADLPVENVSWNAVQLFITRLNEKTGKIYRLPTEKEWLFAAMEGAQKSTYKFSGSHEIKEVGWFHGNAGNRTHPVGKKKPNALGIYDMTGNVGEWCSDKKDSKYAVRESSWKTYESMAVLSVRNSYLPTYKANDIGFRLAMSQY